MLLLFNQNGCVGCGWLIDRTEVPLSAVSRTDEHPLIDLDALMRHWNGKKKEK